MYNNKAKEGYFPQACGRYLLGFPTPLDKYQASLPSTSLPHLKEAPERLCLSGDKITNTVPNKGNKNLLNFTSNGILYLGVILSVDMKWNKHAAYAITKANKTKYPLISKKSPLHNNIKVRLVKGFILPILTYAAVIVFNTNSSLKNTEDIEEVYMAEKIQVTPHSIVLTVAWNERLANRDVLLIDKKEDILAILVLARIAKDGTVPLLLEVNRSVLEYFEFKKSLNTKTNDPDLDFFKSILPDMREMSNDQKRRFKIGILNLAGQILSELHASVLPVLSYSSSSSTTINSFNNSQPVAHISGSSTLPITHTSIRYLDQASGVF
ncbi:hypothetical protein J437_LFUL008030 [Ladona fulva]|uniref:BESS domain-containing protein n=1 Tax=Ladona fulva TaxID=123851 RepID=A0A8K0P2V9_LADFU|nr:hypothetical protein J437_LFUL008030 [Ladona fulva]